MAIAQASIDKPVLTPFKTILLSGIVAGTLDIIAAIFMFSVISKNGTPEKLLQVIASGAFGKSAYSGGLQTAMFGLGFHYLIAFSFAMVYFFLYPYLSFLHKRKILAGLLYGMVVWVIMNLIVLPIVFPKMRPITWNTALTGMAVLMIFIGLPVSLITHKYYSSKAIKHDNTISGL